MVMGWRPSTCDCKLFYKDNKKGNVDNNILKVDPICNIHKNLANFEEIHKAVIIHHIGFELKHGRDPTESQRKDIELDMANEKKRIRNL